MRVYPSWDTVTNKQAEKTQLWQTKYFLKIDNNSKTNLNLAKQLLGTIAETDCRDEQRTGNSHRVDIMDI